MLKQPWQLFIKVLTLTTQQAWAGQISSLHSSLQFVDYNIWNPHESPFKWVLSLHSIDSVMGFGGIGIFKKIVTEKIILLSKTNDCTATDEQKILLLGLYLKSQWSMHSNKYNMPNIGLKYYVLTFENFGKAKIILLGEITGRVLRVKMWHDKGKLVTFS